MILGGRTGVRNKVSSRAGTQDQRKDQRKDQRNKSIRNATIRSKTIRSTEAEIWAGKQVSFDRHSDQRGHLTEDEAGAGGGPGTVRVVPEDLRRGMVRGIGVYGGASGCQAHSFAVTLTLPLGRMSAGLCITRALTQTRPDARRSSPR